MAAIVASQEVGRAPQMAVKAGVPPRQDKERMAALVAAQETVGMPPTAMEAGASLG
jgi:hypothetical protein